MRRQHSDSALDLQPRVLHVFSGHALLLMAHSPDELFLHLSLKYPMNYHAAGAEKRPIYTHMFGGRVLREPYEADNRAFILSSGRITFCSV